MGLSNELSCETGSFSRHYNPHKFLQLYFPTLEIWAARCVLLPSCSSWFICMQMWDHPVCQLPPRPSGLPAAALWQVLFVPPPWLPVSALSTSLNECFSFNSLVVGLPYSSFFWQFWLFFVFKLVVVLVLVV